MNRSRKLDAENTEIRSTHSVSVQSINLSAISVSHTQEEIRFRWWPDVKEVAASILNQEEEKEDTIIGSPVLLLEVSTGLTTEFWPAQDCATTRKMAPFGKRG